MVDDPYEIILEHLRAIRRDTEDMKRNMAQHDKRFDVIERQLAAIRADSAAMQELYVDHRGEFRGLAARVERIERRLDLTDPPQ